jgi:hypothetical protein
MDVSEGGLEPLSADMHADTSDVHRTASDLGGQPSLTGQTWIRYTPGYIRSSITTSITAGGGVVTVTDSPYDAALSVLHSTVDDFARSRCAAQACRQSTCSGLPLIARIVTI